MRCLYSLIIPHYNIPHKLRRLLKSIPKRTDLQVIVVDDMSTTHLDELNKVRQDFPWVDWYDTGTNGGGGKARNIGIRHAIGEYIFFADSDDYFSPEITYFLNKYALVDNLPDIIFCNANAVYEDTGLPSKRTSHLNMIHNLRSTDHLRAETLFRFFFSAPWCKFIKRKIVTENSICFSETPIYNDVRFSYLVGHYCKSIEYYTPPIYVLTESRSSVSYSTKWDTLPVRATIQAEKFRFLRNNGISFTDPALFMLPYMALSHMRPKSFIECIAKYREFKIPLRFLFLGLKSYTVRAIINKITHKENSLVGLKS